MLAWLSQFLVAPAGPLPTLAKRAPRPRIRRGVREARAEAFGGFLVLAVNLGGGIRLPGGAGRLGGAGRQAGGGAAGVHGGGELVGFDAGVEPRIAGMGGKVLRVERAQEREAVGFA